MRVVNKFDIILPPQDIVCESGLQQRLASGDGDAFAWVYKNYCRKVFDYALMMTRNESVSKDAVHDIFLKLWQHRQKLHDVKDFNGYLYALYRNHVLNVLERQQLERRMRSGYSHSQPVTASPADASLLYKECRQLLKLKLSQLPPQQRTVFTLRREYELPHEQIAKLMGIAFNTERSHMVVALGKIRKSFGSYK